MRVFLLAGLLTAGVNFTVLAQTPDLPPPTAAAEQPVLTPNPSRATTVLALATPAPPSDLLTAPLPADQATPRAVPAARPAEMTTTRWVLFGVGLVLAGVLAITAASK